MPENEWEKYSVYVLKAIEAIDKNLKIMDDKMDSNFKSVTEEHNELKQEFKVFKSVMNLKSGTWGAIGSLVGLAVMLGVMLVKGLI